MDFGGRVLKVCFLTETFPPEVNGVAFTLARLARGLSLLNTSVQVLRPQRAYNGSNHEVWEEIDLPSCRIPNYPQLRFGMPCAGRIKKIWLNNKPDIVYLATEGPAGFSALRVAKKMKIPVVSGFHTNFDLYLKHYRISLIKPLVDSYLRWFHNNTSATFAPTDWMISELENKGYKNLRMLSRGVDRMLFSPSERTQSLRKQWGVGKDDKVLLTVSRIAAEKNLDLTCSLFEKMIKGGRAKLGVIVGDGPELIRLSKKFPLLVFTGCLSKTDLAKHYASSDLFLFSSETETFGNVVTEALASGLPVVAYDYAAPSEFIIEGNNGYLASLGDKNELEEKLIFALQNTKETFLQLASLARDSTERADWDFIFSQFRDDLIDVLNENLNSISFPKENQCQLSHT